MHEELKRALAKERRDDREGAKRLMAAAIAGDGDAFGMHYESVSEETLGGIEKFFRAVARMDSPLSDEIRREFTFQWITHKSARGGTRHDLMIIKALRKLLLPYSGPSLCLYRGASKAEKRYGAYGISWSSDRQIAERFAEHPLARMRCGAGGSAVYEVLAPPEAIVGTSCDVGDPYQEREYFVDRRRLGPVQVLREFSHLELEEAEHVLKRLDSRDGEIQTEVSDA